MITYSILFLLTIYLLILLIVLSYSKKRMTKSIKKGLSNSHLVVSTLWAWSSIPRIINFDPSLKDDQHLINQSKLHCYWIYNPFNLFGIFLIILYQIWPRGKSSTRKRRCIYTPSCSHYAIGVLRRYSVLYAIPKIQERLNACNGKTYTYSF